MTIRRLTATLVLGLASSMPAKAETKVLILNQTQLDNEKFFGLGDHTLTSPVTIPKTNGSGATNFPRTNPAGEKAAVYGLGPLVTCLKCINTPPYGPAAGGYLIQTEDYGNAPVYGATISDLTLTGPDDHTMTQFPFGNPTQGAPTCSHLIGTADTDDSPNTSDAFTPAVNDLLVVFVVASDTAQATATLTNSAGLTFSQFRRAAFNGSADSIYGFVSDGLVSSAISQTVTFDTAADPATGTVIFVCSVAGMSRMGLSAVMQSAQQDNQAGGTAPAPAFSTLALPGNPTLGVIGNKSNPAGLAPPTNWTEPATTGDLGYVTPTTGGEYLFRNSGFIDRAITWGGTSSTAFGAMIVELNAEAYAGVRLDAIEAVVDNCHIRQIRGPAVRMYRRGRTGYDGFEYRVSNCRLVHCYVGIEAVTDGRYDNSVVNSIRDYCLYVPTNQGNVQSTENHFFGAQKAIYAVNAEGFHSTNDVFSDAGYGLHLTGYSHLAIVTGGFSQHCWFRNIDAESFYNSFVNCSIKVAIEDDVNSDIAGVEFAGIGNQFIGGSVVLSNYSLGGSHNTVPAGSTAFLFTNDGYAGAGVKQPDDNHVETIVRSETYNNGLGYDDICVRFADYGRGNQIDITIPSGFFQTDTRLLVIDSGQQSGMKKNTITFRGPNLENAVSTPADFIDIASGGIDNTNVVTIIDTDTGNSVTLTPGQAY